jgi:chromosome segregation ATPase
VEIKGIQEVAKRSLALNEIEKQTRELYIANAELKRQSVACNSLKEVNDNHIKMGNEIQELLQEMTKLNSSLTGSQSTADNFKRRLRNLRQL